MHSTILQGLATALMLSTAVPSWSAPPPGGQGADPLWARARAASAQLASGTSSSGSKAAAPHPLGAASVALSDLSITLGPVRISLPRIEALGTDLTPERLGAVLDPASPLSLADRLDALTAASLSAPAIVVESAENVAGKGGGHLVFEDVALTDVVKGRIGSLSVGAVKGVDAVSAGGHELGAASRLRATEIDLPLALRVAQSHRDDAAEAPGVLLGSLTFEAAALFGDSKTAVKLDGMQLVGLRVRPLLKSFGDIAPLLDKGAGSLSADERRDLGAFATDAAGSVSLDHVAWNGLGTSEVYGASDFTLARMAIDGLSPVQIRSWTMDDLALKSREANVTLKHLALHGPDGRALVPYLARSFAALGTGAAPEPLPTLPPQDGSMALVGLSMHVPSNEGTGNSADGRAIDLAIPVVSLTSASDAGGRIRTAMHVGLDAPLPSAGNVPQAATLRQHGVDAIRGGFDAGLSLDAKARSLRLDPLSVSAEKLGALAVSLTLDHLPATLAADGTPPDPRQITLRQAGMTFTDAGLADIVLPLMAASANTSVPLFKAGLKTQAELSIGQVLGTSPVAVRLVAAVNAFLDDPRSFTLTVDAPAGLTVGEIQDAPDPTALVERVEIEAVANR